MTSLGRELGVNPDNIKRWSKEFKSGKLTGVSTIKEKSKEELENIRLRKELAEIKLEHEILKKAVSDYSDESEHPIPTKVDSRFDDDFLG